MSTPIAPAPLPGDVSSEVLLRTLLDISLTAVNLVRPVYAPDSPTIIDFALEYLNPAAQRITGLSAQPGGTLLGRFPHAAGVFLYYRRAFETGEQVAYETNYQADGLDNYFRFCAQRSEDYLLISFSDTSNQDRSAVEEALRESQAAEQAAYANAELQRQRFYDLLMQLPAQVAVHEGPDQLSTLVNPGYQRLATGRKLQGQPIREAWPELVSQGILDVLDQVYHTGEPFIGKEVPLQVDFTRTGQAEQVYLNAFFLPLRDAYGQVHGVLDFSYDVTEQVLARQQVERLNHELEARVQERTQAAKQALAEAERQRLNLVELVQQAPAAICVIEGPDFRYETFNPLYAEMFGGRPQVGQPMGEVLPEVVNHPSFLAFRAVYEEGRTIQQNEVLVQLARPGDGLLEDRYFSYTQQPRHDSQGQITGVFVFAVEVTQQVQARQQVERLNQELEARVQERTQQAEAARAEAERERGELERVFEQAPVAIAVYRGPTYTIELANPTVVRLWGRTREQVIGKELFEALPEVAGMGYEQLLDGVMATGKPYVAHAMEARHERNGSLETVYWDFVYVPVYAAEGHINGAMVVATEVTEQIETRRQVERLNQELEARVTERTREALALQAELLEAAQRQGQERENVYQLFEQAPAAICLLREPNHRIEFLNPAYQALFPGQALQGRTLADTHPADPTLVTLFDGIYKDGKAQFQAEVPVSIPQPAGQPPRTRYFDFAYQVYREQGRIAGVSIFGSDVTERVLARQEREAQQQLMRIIFEQAPAGIWVVREPDFLFEFINPAMTRLLGHSQEQVLGRPYFKVLPELVSQGLPEMLHRVWQGESVLVEELPARLAHHAPGEVGYFTFAFAPLRDEHGQVSRISCVALDVTPQVQAREQVQILNEELAVINEEIRSTNEELNQSNLQLTRTNVDLDTFVYTASHDLKAPITNIEGLLEALQYHLPAEVRKEETTSQLLDMMQGAVERFQFTINQLTDISRLQQAQDQPAEQVQLATVIKDVQLDLRPLLLSTRAEITLEVGLEVYALFSFKSLRAVVANLLSNALKYHQPGRPPIVRLRASYHDQWVVLEVQDEGLGLTKSQQERLFELFQRLHTHVEGSGVGLYMVKRLVENAGGTIAVQSKEGVGSTFTVTLPTGRTR